ncbi:class I SAM-dependent DNA methyltransferase [Corynebacterium xerosis]|uniref:class I SAM-dependent DNA methyltransferase n=1 Tax=Corynebacterium xerosis TaxID=1725 RepID=UPI0013CE5F22|nr:class I SAM-dependent DNA methyltransferase [Corynebacterium xerosis]
MTKYLKLVNEGRFNELFEELGWGRAPAGVNPVSLTNGDGASYTAKPIADQAGLRVWLTESPQLPSPADQRAIDAAVKLQSEARLLIFTNGLNQAWRWPRRGATAATSSRLLNHQYTVGDEDQGSDLERRLNLIELPVGQRVGIMEIQARMATAFNEEAVKRSHEASQHMVKMNQQLLDAGCDTETSSSLLVRLLFLFFGDDTNMWAPNAFQNWVLHKTTAENLHQRLPKLFRVLADPELGDGNQQKYTDTEFQNFRQIGGMYEEELKLPPLDENFRQQVLDACNFNWGKVNPDIFGAMFQHLVDLEELRKSGEHYTSEENIMKVLEPLFLDEYRNKLTDAWDDVAALRNLQDDLATLHFLDPACGCGNFLIQAYKQLRGLELSIINRLDEFRISELDHEIAKREGLRDSALQRKLKAERAELLNEAELALGSTLLRRSKLSMRQFFGIEINSWPAKVARTAMLLVDHLCNMDLGQSAVRLPIEETPEILEGNALRIDWRDILDPKECHYIIGNPPFIGKLTKEQHADREFWFGKTAGRIDYVGSWIKAAAQYMKDTRCKAAFVSTNSISQGVQVKQLWKPLMDDGLIINFAHRSFKWKTESKSAAQVSVIVVGFSYSQNGRRTIWDYSNGVTSTTNATHINAYLVDYPNIFVEPRTTPINGNTAMLYGGKPADHGYLIFSGAEYDELAVSDPGALAFIRPFKGGEEFIKGKRRYCLWIAESDLAEIANHPELSRRVAANQQWRSEQIETGAAYAGRNIPWRFQQMPSGDIDVPYLLIPSVTSEARRYFPIGFIDDGTVPSNLAFFMPNATVYEFGLLSSRVHNVWLEHVGGRLDSRTRYANRLVYNTFVWPEVDDLQRDSISSLAQGVLDERARLASERRLTLREMYAPGRESLYGSLFSAHESLDAAVESAYGFPEGADEQDIIKLLFNLYDRASSESLSLL